jgi:hypothetical protein
MNKYTKIYNSLVESRKLLDRKFTTGCGFEKHHIIPKCLGGIDDESNYARLIPEEHHIAHQLLSACFPKHAGLASSAFLMSGRRSEVKRLHKSSPTDDNG